MRGGGDLGSACALRLARVGFKVLVAERARPTVVRRTVAFAEAVYTGTATVEEMTARRVESRSALSAAWTAGEVPVVIDPHLAFSLAQSPRIVLDATMAKRNLGMSRSLPSRAIGLGPGFVAGVDVDAVIETNRGPHLGRVIWSDSAEPNTGVPAPINGYAGDRVLRAPIAGTLDTLKSIGDVVAAGELVAAVSGRPIRAPFHGTIRGLLRAGSSVHASMKVGDIDPRIHPDLHLQVSDKALAVAGGVLEAALVLLHHGPRSSIQ